MIRIMKILNSMKIQVKTIKSFASTQGEIVFKGWKNLFLQGHESISKTNLISPLEKCKPPSKPCSSSNINHEESLSDLEVPIAFWKGIKSCTQHPMSNFMSYKNLSSSMVAFTSQLSSVEILKNVENALKFQSGRRLFLRKWGPLRRIRLGRW